MVVWLKPCESRSSPGFTPENPAACAAGFSFFCRHPVSTWTCDNNFTKSFKFLKQVVDKAERPAIIGGSQRRKTFGSNDEAASATTSTPGEAALKKGVDEAEKPAIMGGFATKETSQHTGTALRPLPWIFES
ncbi:hypothetical protein, partial [Stenotrophomonas maltophilia]|uniref:hypothetical protein n=1 Tax=Stenotrophomonas maltophilia TaxID=40324 RepID=UPI001C60DFEE